MMTSEPRRIEPMSKDTKRTLRSGEIASELGLAAVTVQGYAREGRIPATQTPGGQYRFDLDEVRSVLFPSSRVTQFHPSRLIDPAVGGSFLVRGSAESIEVDPASRESLTGFVREARVQRRNKITVTVTPAPREPSFDERRAAVQRATHVFDGAPVAAFSVLK